MKVSIRFISAAVLAAFAAAPALANTIAVDFEQSWSYGSLVDNAYAAQGVSFTNFVGLSNNDGLGNLPNGDYYENAPSPLGVSYVQLDGVVNSTSFMNVDNGVANLLSFFYSSPSDITGAVKAYSGLNGSGTLLGTFDLSANSDDYTNWTQVLFNFTGIAHSFDFTGSANAVAFDDIASVPEPGSVAMVLAGLGLLGFARRNRR